MSVLFDQETAQYVLDCDYELNTVSLSETTKMHTHQFIEMVYTLSGTGIHWIDGKQYHVKSGDLLWINYHSQHTIVPTDKLRYVDIMLKPEYVNQTLLGTEDLFLLLQLQDFSGLSSHIIRDNVVLHFHGEEREKIEFLLSWSYEEQKNKASAGPLVIRSALSMLLCMMFRKMTEHPHARPGINDQLLMYIDRNCHLNLSIHEIAAQCGYGAEHFSRLFRQYTGKTPMLFIHECRIRRAKQLLKETNQSVDEIIATCGYSNRTAFFRKFSALVGTTPLSYRKNQK